MAELDPNFQYRQAATGTMLQGVQLGASIAERRQVMEMRRQQMEQDAARFATQSKLAEAQLAFDRERAAGDLQEAAAWAEDAKVLAPYQNQFTSWANDPSKPIPSAPPVKSRQGLQIVNGLLNQASGYSAQARLAKARDEQQKLEYNLIAKEIEDDNKLIANTGKNFRMYTQSNPKGYERDPAIYQEALNINARNQTFRSMSAGESAMLPDEELSKIANIPIDRVPQFKAMLAGNKDIVIDKMPQAVKYVESLQKSGIQMSDEDREYVIAQFLSPGVTMNVPAKQLNEITEEASNLRMLDKAINAMDAFNEKYKGALGPNAFEKFVGPIDNGVVEQAARLLPEKQRGQAISDAKNAFESVSKVVQAYRRAQYGTALTASETGLFATQVRDPKFADYPRSIRNFRNNMAEELQGKLGYFKYAPNIPLGIKKQILGSPVEMRETYAGEFEAKERAELEELRRKKAASQQTR